MPIIAQRSLFWNGICALFALKIEKKIGGVRGKVYFCGLNIIKRLKKKGIMDMKDKKENFFLKLIEIKKEIRNCVQNGGNLHQIEKQYGIRFTKPL